MISDIPLELQDSLKTLLWISFVLLFAYVIYRSSLGVISRVVWAGVDRKGTVNKRRETAETLLRHAARYAIFFAAIFFLAGVLLKNVLPAVAGASILAIVIGFGLQTFLKDIIAGFFILFEGQYSVGDQIALAGPNISGRVVEFGLRTTVLRGAGGHFLFVPNGTITAVENFGDGPAHLVFELTLRSEAEGALKALLEELPRESDLFNEAPLFKRKSLSGDKIAYRVTFNVQPEARKALEGYLGKRLTDELGEKLLSDPLCIYSGIEAGA